MLYSDDVLRKVVNIAKGRMINLYWFYCITPFLVILSELSENPYKTPTFGILIALMYIMFLLLLSEYKPYSLVKSIAGETKLK